MRKVHACIEVLPERADTERSKQPREMLGQVLGGSQLRVQVAVVLNAMQNEKEQLPEVFALGLDLHSCGCRAQLPSLGRRRQARRKGKGLRLWAFAARHAGAAAKTEGCAGKTETPARGCHATLRGVGRRGGGGKRETGAGWLGPRKCDGPGGHGGGSPLSCMLDGNLGRSVLAGRLCKPQRRKGRTGAN